LFLQIGILTLCLIADLNFVTNFPFPSPLIKSFLPPKLRWPGEQIAQWTEANNYEPGFLNYFNRDPERVVPSGDNLVSPSDGVIKEIIYRNNITYYILGLSFWDVHVVRTPVAGVVKNIEHEGLVLSRKSETENQVYLDGKDGPVQAVVTIGSEHGDIKVRLITSYFAKRLQVSVHVGDKLEKGERIGRILLGSSVVVEIPGQVQLSVQTGARVRGGETVILEGKNFI
jgi:phosphatidylserine decarboxylase